MSESSKSEYQIIQDLVKPHPTPVPRSVLRTSLKETLASLNTQITDLQQRLDTSIDAEVATASAVHFRQLTERLNQSAAQLHTVEQQLDQMQSILTVLSQIEAHLADEAALRTLERDVLTQLQVKLR